MGFLYPKRFISAGTTSLRYRSCNRLMAVLFLQCRAAAASNTLFGAVGHQLMAHTRVLVAGSAQQQHVRDLNRAFLLHDAALHVLGGIGARVPLDDSGVLDCDCAAPRVNSQHAAGLALIAPAHHAYLIALTNARICNRGIHESFLSLCAGFTRLPGPAIRSWRISFPAIHALPVQTRVCLPAHWHR